MIYFCTWMSSKYFDCWLHNKSLKRGQSYNQMQCGKNSPDTDTTHQQRSQSSLRWGLEVRITREAIVIARKKTSNKIRSGKTSSLSTDTEIKAFEGKLGWTRVDISRELKNLVLRMLSSLRYPAVWRPTDHILKWWHFLTQEPLVSTPSRAGPSCPSPRTSPRSCRWCWTLSPEPGRTLARHYPLKRRECWSEWLVMSLLPLGSLRRSQVWVPMVESPML